jgi:hypothetical protein
MCSQAEPGSKKWNSCFLLQAASGDGRRRVGSLGSRLRDEVGLLELGMAGVLAQQAV